MTSNADRRRVVGRIRRKNEDEFGEGARAAVQKLLSAGLPHSWMYIYELTQNAVDAGASRVCWRSEGDAVTFQHDGPLALEESHVKGLSSLGASTKGLATVGFMGVGFKSVFARFREARVSDADWRFRFDVRVRCGDLESKVPEWFDTLRPHWDDEVPAPDAGYTTAFLLGRPAEPQRPVTDDLELLASTANRTTLAVLARRGLTQVSVEDVVWELSVEDDIVTVRHSGSEARWRWKAFVAHYRPDDAAMRRFLEVRQETHEQADPGGRRAERQVVGLLPLDDNGLPQPADRGCVYATLPTQVQIPFRIPPAGRLVRQRRPAATARGRWRRLAGSHRETGPGNRPAVVDLAVEPVGWGAAVRLPRHLRARERRRPARRIAQENARRPRAHPRR